ncbi:phosphoribosylamine--glycine ligase [Parvularcula sp. IMCC14364]|uniref:phosphoribosylamine--glycine ligase n=1 Tax=Parvularcula sp. IMCC14364 TaxID=3067902 RepID=UPI002741FCC1|nr:phosphoribosylamine--glycine ligase [Parvularcula sp. IMCC14364]
MKILLIGGGGREHALAWKIAQSPLLTGLYCAPGNPGTVPLGTNVPLKDTDVEGIVSFAMQENMDLVVVGPEAPLALGLADRLEKAGIACFGPSQEAAQIEASKGYLKDLCQEHDIPTAAYGRFDAAAPAKAFLSTMSAPYVIKADGLAAGKGVVIAEDLAEAESAIDDMLGGRFGAASAELVIEEFLEGEEASFFAITDGTHIVPMVGSQDHKRALDGDKGPNTGGMGAYSPAPVFTPEIQQEVIARIIAPTVKALSDRGSPYCGVLYAGLMIGADGPKLIEYNARFGDPECQVMMRRMQSDILPVLMAAATGKLAGQEFVWTPETVALVVMATQGYPGSYAKGSVIKDIEKAQARDGVEVFHAGTSQTDGQLTASGGRVLNVTAGGATGRIAVDRAYDAVAQIDWPEGFYRRDIGWRMLQRETT